MSQTSVFDFVKEHIPLSDYVRTLPQTNGLHSTGRSKWRCNNILSGGSNKNSMSIDDELGYFKMFSHGQESGDVIKLYSLVNGGIPQFDSAVGLAQHMGLVVDEELLTMNSGEQSVSSLTDAMNTIAQRAHTYLRKSQSPDAQKVLLYLRKRGMSTTLIDSWSLGFLPNNADDLKEILHGFDDKTLSTIGVYGKNNFVSMRGRLVFPIFNTQGKAISLSSRTVDGVNTPLPDSKYINTPSTKIYAKSETLYGQHLLKRSTQKIIVCEGNMDVIALNEQVDNDTVAVATCGTALTQGHVSLLSRYSPKAVYIMFDSDDPGQESLSKLVWLHNHWDKVFYSPVQGAKDPWEVYEKGVDITPSLNSGVSVMQAALRHKSSVLDKREFIQWCKSTYKTLNFTDDKSLFIEDAAHESGTKRSFMEKQISISDTKELNPSSFTDSGNHDFSDEFILLLSCLSEFDADDRKNIAFPLAINNVHSTVSTICGCATQDHIDVLKSIVKGERGDVDRSQLSQAYGSIIDGVTPESVSRILSRTLVNEWRKTKVPDNARKYIPALMSIAQGTSSASGVHQLSFVFDAAATA